jgi:Leucine-rich repeat (LRR) protein
MEDVETVIEDNSRLKYFDAMNNEYNAQQITVISIVTDEGVLDPLGVGEIEIEVRY